MERKALILSIVVITTILMWFLVNPNLQFTTIPDQDGTTTTPNTNTLSIPDPETSSWPYTFTDIPVLDLSYNAVYDNVTDVLTISGSATLTNLDSVTSTTLTEARLLLIDLSQRETEVLSGTYDSFTFSNIIVDPGSYECDIKITANYVLGGSTFTLTKEKRFFVTVEEEQAFIDVEAIPYDTVYSLFGLIALTLVSIYNKKRKLRVKL